MLWLILGILIAVLIGIAVPKAIPASLQSPMVSTIIRGCAGVLLLFVVASTSFTHIGEDGTGHMMKIYGTGELQNGAILSVDGSKGPQAEILPPGFHFRLLLNVVNDVTEESVVKIPEGKFGLLVAKDGAQLRTGQTYADPIEAMVGSDGKPVNAKLMISDAAYFLQNGGQKGPQTSVLTPGTHRINKFLWDVAESNAVDIPKGHVGVIKSNVHAGFSYGNLTAERPMSCKNIDVDLGIDEEPTSGGKLAVPLVPVGCVGIWSEALNPGRYYLNDRAYVVQLFDTRVQKWEYRGGYPRRVIDLSVDHEGKITQAIRTEEIPVPEGAADRALDLKMEGWTTHQAARVLVQVTPKLAPFVVASVGNLPEVENRIMTPAFQSEMRDIAGGHINVPNSDGEIITRPTRVLDLIENRALIEDQVEKKMVAEGRKAGVVIREVRLMEPDFPPEVLLPSKRKQLAEGLVSSYEQEKLAQESRVTMEREKATADQQDQLVKAQIQRKRAEEIKEARKAEGQGERAKLEEIAEGQKAQVGVLGEERVVELRKFELVLNGILNFVGDNPSVLQAALENAHKFVPERVYTSGGGDLSGALAMFGDILSTNKVKPAVSPAGTPTK
jgi:regulator of protease activity HflC (stomatin/prohibitin superfamily)